MFWSGAVGENEANQENLSNKKVTIYVWEPKLNGQTSDAVSLIKARIGGQVNNQLISRIGHVAIQTNNHYASWWPSDEDANRVSLFNVVGAQNSNFDQDCRSEGTQPDLVICFYTLDVEEIETAFQEVKDTKNYGYVLSGDKKAVRLLNASKGNSCCGLAYELLEAGGILKLSSYHKDITAKWWHLTVENFTEFLRNAKQYEVSQFPQTRGYALAGEYVPALQESNCVLQ